MVGRTNPEWVGATPDSKPPKSVRLRVFAAYGGRCYLSKRLIRPGEAWELEHVKPLHLGGENREGNMAPALVDAHRRKTAAEMSAKAKADRIRAKHLGIWPESKAKIKSRGFEKTRPQPSQRGGV